MLFRQALRVLTPTGQLSSLHSGQGMAPLLECGLGSVDLSSVSTWQDSNGVSVWFFMRKYVPSLLNLEHCAISV